MSTRPTTGVQRPFTALPCGCLYNPARAEMAYRCGFHAHRRPVTETEDEAKASMMEQDPRERY